MEKLAAWFVLAFLGAAIIWMIFGGFDE